MPGEVRTWYLYVVRCADDSLYTGISVDVTRRIDQHNRGKGAAYTASRRPVTLLAAWAFEGHAAALKAERALKSLSRKRKVELIESRRPFKEGMVILPTFFGSFCP